MIDTFVTIATAGVFWGHELLFVDVQGMIGYRHSLTPMVAKMNFGPNMCKSMVILIKLGDIYINIMD